MNKKTPQRDIFKSLTGVGKKRQKQHASWVEDAFHFDTQQGKHTPLPETATHTSSSVTARHITRLVIVILAVVVIMLARVAQLQIAKGGEYRELAQGNSQRIIPIPAERGLLFDRNGLQLTENVPKFSLTLVPQELPRSRAARDELIVNLAALTGQESETISELLDEFGAYSYESIIIEDDIDYETALAIQIEAADLPGISIQRGSKRLYLHASSTDQGDTQRAHSLSHVLGYEGKLSRAELDALYSEGYLPSDDIGKTGVEKVYEAVLRGTYGKRRTEVDAVGRLQAILAEEAPQPGHHVRLTIDMEIQQMLEDAMTLEMDRAGKRKGAGIVMNVNTGEILALVSLPSFDNNDFSGGIDQETYSGYISDTANPLLNRTIAGRYPSGSTIKPAVAAIALDENIITPQTSFLSSGGLRIGQWFFPDWQAGGHGNTNVTRAIAWSVNTFFYYIGGGYEGFNGLGVDMLTTKLRDYGFASQLGVDLPGELSGLLPSQEWKLEKKGEQWYIGDTYNISIGQGDVLVTPLQIAAMTSLVANGGTLYTPRIAAAIVDPTTELENTIDPSIVRSNVSTPNNLAVVRQGMRECVTYGSCRRLSLLPFETAGKTGTAQWSSLKEDHAWFTSFAPYANPEIAVTILVEEGEGGSKIGAPIAYEFYKNWWTYRQQS